MLLYRGQPISGDVPALGDTHQGDTLLWGPSDPVLQPPACDTRGRGTLGAASCHAAHDLKIVSSSRALGKKIRPFCGSHSALTNWCHMGSLGTGLDSQPHRWQVAFSPHWGATRSWRKPTATRWCACSATSPTSTPVCSTATTTSVPAACEAVPATAACAAHSAGKGQPCPGTPGWGHSTGLAAHHSTAPCIPKAAQVGVPLLVPISTPQAPLSGEGRHGAAPRGPAPAVPGGQLSRQRGERAVCQL